MTYKVIVSGKVQRVGYRNFIYKNALKLNIKGSIKNLENKNVEIYFYEENEKNKRFFFKPYQKRSLTCYGKKYRNKQR